MIIGRLVVPVGKFDAAFFSLRWVNFKFSILLPINWEYRVFFAVLSCSSQSWNFACGQNWNRWKQTEHEKRWVFRFGTGSGRACRAANAARPAVCQASDGAQVASPQSLILRRSASSFMPKLASGNKNSQQKLTFPTLIAPRLFSSHYFAFYS